jgi:hypothetical protein
MLTPAKPMAAATISVATARARITLMMPVNTISSLALGGECAWRGEQVRLYTRHFEKVRDRPYNYAHSRQEFANGKQRADLEC